MTVTAVHSSCKYANVLQEMYISSIVLWTLFRFSLVSYIE